AVRPATYEPWTGRFRQRSKRETAQLESGTLGTETGVRRRTAHHVGTGSFVTRRAFYFRPGFTPGPFSSPTIPRAHPQSISYLGKFIVKRLSPKIPIPPLGQRSMTAPRTIVVSATIVRTSDRPAFVACSVDRPVTRTWALAIVPSTLYKPHSQQQFHFVNAGSRHLAHRSRKSGTGSLSGRVGRHPRGCAAWD